MIELPIDSALDDVKYTMTTKEFVLLVCLSASFIDIETAETSPPIAGDDVGLLTLSMLVRISIP